MYAGKTNFDIDKEYSPSLCSTRFQDTVKPDDAVLANFLKVITEDTEVARLKYKKRQEVRYGGENDNQLLDIYYKEQEESTPIFAFIHGGYWQYLSKNESGSFVGPLVERGYRVVVPDYNLCPTVTLEQLTQQICNFFKWLLNYANETGACEIHLSGHSCGAHLLTFLLSNDFLSLPGAANIKSLFFISGVYDLRELWALECVNTKNIFSLDESKAAELSPILKDVNAYLVQFYNKTNLKLHVLVAEHDSDTFKGQTLAYAQKLQEAGFNVTQKVFEKYDHFDIIEETATEGSAISSYICSHLE